MVSILPVSRFRCHIASQFLRKAGQFLLHACANRQFQFHKSGQLFIRRHNEPLSIVAMRVSNPDCSPVGFKR
jgi:hypothetical protein